MYEIKLSDGQVITWPGKDGLDACRRYANAHPAAAVIAAPR